MPYVIDYESLFQAAREGQAARVRSLLAAGANLTMRSKAGMTPAHLASANGRLEALKVMLDSGLSPNVTSVTDKTPLHVALNAETVRLLRAAGASCEASDKYGRRPLHAAVKDRRHDVAEALLADGAIVCVYDIWGSTPLHEAGDAATASLLLAAEACVNARDGNGKTPLHEAAAEGCDEVVDVLVKAGADINARDKAGATPLHCARYFTTIKRLLALGANPSLCDARGRTPLAGLQAMGIDQNMIAGHAFLPQESLLAPA